MLDGFPVVPKRKLTRQVKALKEMIENGSFSEKAGNTFEISPDAVIELSEEVDVSPSKDRPRPIFDLMISPDPLTVRVANRLYPELKRMGFEPVLVIGKYTMPEKTPEHPLLANFVFQNKVFNQVVLPMLHGTAIDSERQFLTPEHLAQTASISKVLDKVDNVNDPSIVGYIGSKKKQVGIAHTFRLYNLVGKTLIGIFSRVSESGRKTEWGIGAGHVKTTCFTSHYFHPVHSKKGGKEDKGQRRSLITNIHPSLMHHGVIPPFWQQYHMMKLMEKLGVDYEDYKGGPQKVADICVKYAKDTMGIDYERHSPQEVEQIRKKYMAEKVGVDYENDTPQVIEAKYKKFVAENPDCPLQHIVDPYLNGMIHHIEPRYDTGDRILIAQNKVPIDLNKPVWENYFAMEEMIVKSTLALAAAYKLGLDLKGQEQDLMQTYYHSYPGPDSNPPAYLSEEVKQAILENDVPALDEFERMGGKLCSREHFESIIYGDPDTGTPGFVIPGTTVEARLRERIDDAYKDRKNTRNGNHVNDNGRGGGISVTSAKNNGREQHHKAAHHMHDLERATGLFGVASGDRGTRHSQYAGPHPRIKPEVYL